MHPGSIPGEASMKSKRLADTSGTAQNQVIKSIGWPTLQAPLKIKSAVRQFEKVATLRGRGEGRTVGGQAEAGIRMIRITITAAAFEAIAATLPLGSVAGGVYAPGGPTDKRK